MRRTLLIAFGILLLAFLGIALLKRSGPGAESGADRVVDAKERDRLVQFWESYNRGTRLRTAGRFFDAVIHYRLALKTNPNHEESVYYLGNCLFEIGNYSEASDWFERLIELNPRSQRGYSQIAAISSLLAPGAPLNYQRAAEALERNLKLDPEESGSFLRLGQIALEQNQLSVAFNHLNHAAGFGSPAGMFWAGFVRFQQGRYEDAAVQFQKVIRLAAREREIALRGARGEGDLATEGSATELTPLEKAELKSRIFLYWCGPEFREPIKDFIPPRQVADSSRLKIRSVPSSEAQLPEGRFVLLDGSERNPASIVAVSTDGVSSYAVSDEGLDTRSGKRVQGMKGGWDACRGDIDHDGRDDLYVIQSGFVGTGQNRLYLNRSTQESLMWREVTREYGLLGERATASARFVDIDGDGDLDLIEAGNSSPQYSALRLFRRTQNGFEETSSSQFQFDGNVTDLVVADFDDDGWPDIGVSRWKRAPLFFRNSGDGTFIEKQPPAFSRVQGTALASSVIDYNRDKRPDLLIAERSGYETALSYLCREGRPALKDGTVLLFRNEGDWNFQDVTSEVGLDRYPGAIDLIAADFNKDTWPDLLVVNGGLPAYWRIPSQILLNENGERFTVAAIAPNFLPIRATGAVIIPMPGKRMQIALGDAGLFEVYRTP